MRYRIEKDTIGEKQVPAEAYYGIGSLRSKETFSITKHGLIRQMIKSFASIKKAAAKANGDVGLLDKEIANAISLSCDEILNGRLHGQFITDVIQGGSGNSMNVNANEVIANRANELLGGEKGKYDLVHPINHVNLNQNSRQVVITAGKLSTIRLTKKMIGEAKKLYNAYLDKINEYNLEKSDYQIGQELLTFADILDRDIKRVNAAILGLLDINVLHPSMMDSDSFEKKYIKYLAQFSGEPVKQAKNAVDNDQNIDAFIWVSSAIKTLISNLSKISNDLVILEKQDKVQIPQVDELSDPVVIEMVKQVSFYIMGNDLTIARAVEAGELESNIYLPIIYGCLFESINLLRRTIRIFREKTIEGLIIK